MLIPEPAILIGALIAGFIQGVSGFAYALVASAMWVWIIEPDTLVPLVIATALVGQLASLRHVSKAFDFKRSAPFFLGGLIGIPVGTTLFQLLSADMFRLAIGVVLIAYASIMLWRPVLPVVRTGGKLADAACGGLGGMMGAMGGLSGPPVVIWCALRGWDKDVQRATSQPLFFMIGCVSLFTLAWNGAISAATARLVLATAPFVLISAWAGTRLYGILPQRVFTTILFILLLLSGASLAIPFAAQMFVVRIQ